MSFSILVENIKCGGCVNSIVKQLTAIEGVAHVIVDIENGKVTCQLEVDREVTAELVTAVKSQLHKMGYPEVGSVEGLKAAGAKAKSFVSCAIGKMTDPDSSKQCGE